MVSCKLCRAKLPGALIDEESFLVPDMKRKWWAHHYPAVAKAAVAVLARGDKPALMGFIESCSIFEDGSATLLSAACILERLRKDPNRGGQP